MEKRNSDGTFNKGNSFGKGNGRPSVPQDIKDARKVNREKLENCLHEYLHKSLRDLADICQCHLLTVGFRLKHQPEH